MTIRFVLGAPGSGKSALQPELRALLPGWAVLDWDAWMAPAAALAGRSVPEHEELWQPYGELVREVVAALASVPVLLVTVCTPAELADWPQGRWLVLDCGDAERAARLRRRGDAAPVVAEALQDAAQYRSLGLELLDTTSTTVPDVAAAVARWASRPPTS